MAARYLDDRFPSLGALIAGIDAESDRLSALRSQHASEMATERSRLAEQAARATRDRHATVDAALVAIAQGRIPDENIDFGPEFARAFAEIQSLYDLRTAKSLLARVSQPSFTREDALNIEPQLRSLVSRGGTASEVAMQALERCRDISEPVVHAKCSALAQALKEASWPHKLKIPPESALEALRKAVEVDREAAFAELARPLDDRIRFNFERIDSATARADKPEWLLGYVSKCIDPHIEWLSAEFGPRGPANLAAALLPSFARALGGYFVAVSGDPLLLRHLITESLVFDALMRQKYLVSGQSGTTSRLLMSSNLDIFVAGEHRQALEGIAVCVDEGSDIDFDADCCGAKPTFAAQNVRQLFNSATQLLRTEDEAGDELIEAQLRIVREVHIPLLDAFHTALETDLRVDDLTMLARVYGSAAFIRQFLTSASTDSHFVRLWRVLDDAAGEEEEEEGMFDATAARFEELHTRASQLIIKLLVRQFKDGSRTLVRQDWYDHPVGAGVGAVVSALQPSLRFISRLCASSPADLARIMVPVSARVADILWTSVVQANTFSIQGGQQLGQAVNELWSELSFPRTPLLERLESAAMILGGHDGPSVLSDEEVLWLRRRRVDAPDSARFRS